MNQDLITRHPISIYHFNHDLNVNLQFSPQDPPSDGEAESSITTEQEQQQTIDIFGEIIERSTPCGEDN